MTTCDELYESCSPAEGRPTRIKILQFDKRKRTEVGQRETMNVFAEQNDKQNHHRYSTAEGCRNSRPFHPEFGTAELTEISE